MNVGCIPSKALLASSHHYHDVMHNVKAHGINIDPKNVEFSVDTMQEAKGKTVKGLTGGIEHLLKKYKVNYIKGHGAISGPNEVTVKKLDGTEEKVTSSNILIATGSEVTPLPPAPVDNAGQKIVDSTGALEIAAIPKTMAVIGGGVIGLEMGSVWSRLGTKVTVIEFMDRLCPAMDKELTKKFQTTLKKQGFNFQMKTKVMATAVEADGVQVTTEASAGGKEKTEKVIETVSTLETLDDISDLMVNCS